MLSQDWEADFAVKDCLFGAVKLTENAGPEKYSHSGCSIGFDSHSVFSFSKFWLGWKCYYFLRRQ